jgi:hypothetical protein
MGKWAMNKATYLRQRLYPFIAWFKNSVKFQGATRRREVAKLFRADRNEVIPFYRSDLNGQGTKKNVLFASFLPLPYILKMEGLFSRLLQGRGWSSLCLYTLSGSVSADYHGRVFGGKNLRLDKFIPWSRYDDVADRVRKIGKLGVDSVKSFEYKGCPVGLHALATLSSSDPTGALNLDGFQTKNIENLLIRSCLNVEACDTILEQFRPDLVIGVEKGVVECCEIFYRAVDHGVPYVQWHGCHEPESIMLKRYHSGNKRAHPFSISPGTWKLMKEKPWDERYRESVFLEFEEGYSQNKWFKYKKLTDHTGFFNRSEIEKRYSLDPGKKIAIIFSHILNDANLFYGNDLFRGGFPEWLVETVAAALKNGHVNWVLKLHPANIYRRASSGYLGEYGEILAIKEAFGGVPKELKIMYPEDNVNPLSLFHWLDYGLTVRGTVGAEIPCFGRPVLTAGSGRYSGLGFTEDSDSAEEYLGKVLRIQEIPPLDVERTRLAIKHAYLFFKARPAKYDTFAKDVYAYPQGHPFYRDICFDKKHYTEASQNGQVAAIIDWMTESLDEDFLTL